MEVAANLEEINHKIERACIKSNRLVEDITLIGVTKYVTIERTKEAIQAGICNLGENRLEGFQEKYDSLQETDVKWHFIGTLQSRKVKEVIHQVDVIHSLDRLSLAKEINKRAEKTIDCFVQVNVSKEESKHGIMPEEVLTFIGKLRDFSRIRVVGLMTMAPHIEDKEALRQVFKRLASLRKEVQEKGYDSAPCAYLSMGMSNDFELAIEEGATHIRIGTKLVG
ncbi:YggS family pyridoxal phosphate-dependent enzyme [Oceanobacillus manasiensis]|uniref:YggS family pyridoxal phosphate-dependent enzyme n=1 Tax=Oceanobacillus manasiensis TaxID=586413 RepID=UPI0005A89682|nr:YggS family pyridoxal phosphate-dependent enzyme [Oceanobacillus manasiensis]